MFIDSVAKHFFSLQPLLLHFSAIELSRKSNFYLPLYP